MCALGLISTVAYFFRANARKIYERQWNKGNVWKATRKRESRARFNFYVYEWLSIHCLYFICARKIYKHSQGKITRQRKSTLRVKLRQHCHLGLDEATWPIWKINLSPLGHTLRVVRILQQELRQSFARKTLILFWMNTNSFPVLYAAETWLGNRIRWQIRHVVLCCYSRNQVTQTLKANEKQFELSGSIEKLNLPSLKNWKLLIF